MQNMTPTSYLERLRISRDQVELFLEQPNLNLFQAAIAVLLVEGKPLPLSDLADRVEELGFDSAVGDMEHSLRKAWHGQRPIYRDDADRFGLDLGTPEMEHFLMRLRVATRPTATRAEPKERAAQVAVRIEESRLKQEEEQRSDEEQLASWRRAILHVEPSPQAPAAAVVLDMGERTIETFLSDQRGELQQVLAKYDWLAGLSIRATLTGLGLDAERFRLAELSPAQKTRTLNRQGKKLTITPELVIASTTGISRPLGDPEKIAQYLAERQDTKMARRLESTAKALHAFYQQGALHGSVRLRWGFVDEHLSLGWDNRGEQSLRRTLKQACEADTCVDIVTGAVPGWENPWARVRRVAVLSVDPWTVRLRDGLADMELSYDEIRAIRLTDPTLQRSIGPVPPLS